MSNCSSLGVPHDLCAAAAPAIQPRGWAIVCDAQAAKVTGYSANLAGLLPHQGESILGAALRELVGSETSHALRNALSRATVSPRPALLPSRGIADCEGLYDCAVHTAGEHTIIEIEPAAEPDHLALDRARALVDRLAQAKGLQKLLPLAARLAFSLLQWDWVAILRLPSDGSVRVLAQHKRLDRPGGGRQDGDAEFSAEARADCRAAGLRFISDVAAPPVDLVGATAPDLAHAQLRAATPAERARAARAGFAAVLNLPILVEGELWGVLVAENREARDLTMDERAVFELFGDFLSLSVQSALWRQTASGARRPHTLWSGFQIT